MVNRSTSTPLLARCEDRLALVVSSPLKRRECRTVFVFVGGIGAVVADGVAYFFFFLLLLLVVGVVAAGVVEAEVVGIEVVDNGVVGNGVSVGVVALACLGYTTCIF